MGGELKDGAIFTLVDSEVRDLVVGMIKGVGVGIVSESRGGDIMC